jgi:uncharacterized protein YhdP
MEHPLKRIIVGLLAAFLTFTGLVSFSSETASAACPYTNCVATQTSSTGTRVSNAKMTYKVTVKASGNVVPAGRVTISVRRNHTTAVIYSNVRRIARAGANSASTNLNTPTLKRGTYEVTFTYSPDANTVFKSSKQVRIFQSL